MPTRISMDISTMSAQFGQFSDSLKVLGKSELADTTVGGKLTVGLISIDDLKADISAMNGLLSFQRGSVTVDGVGNIITVGSITAKKLNFAEDNPAPGSTVLGASIGQAVIPAGQLQVEVTTTAVTAKSKIFTSARSKTGKQTLLVNQLTPGTSFTIRVEDSYSHDIVFDWWVVN